MYIVNGSVDLFSEGMGVGGDRERESERERERERIIHTCLYLNIVYSLL